MTLRRARLTIFATLTLLVCSGTMLFAAGPALAQVVIHVDEDAGGANDGTSWTDAFTDLQDAFSASQSGDEIWVAEGVYKPDGGVNQTTGDRDSTFELVDGVGVYGGFDGVEDVREDRDSSPATNGTVLSGEIGNQSDVIDNSYNVVTSEAVSDSTVLDGFTVTGGYASANSTVQGRGGGLYNGDGVPRLRNLAFEENTARFFGGGLHNESGSLELSDITFSNNQAYANSGDGGGMSGNRNSEATLTDVSFVGNTAVRNGGGLYSDRSILTLMDVTFEENEAGSGGGMYSDRSTVAMEDGGFEANSATNSGGGAYNTGNSAGGDFRFDGVSFTQNVAGDGGGMFSLGGGANPTANATVVDSTFTENEAENAGGGMANSESDSIVTGTVFSGNTAVVGGGMRNSGGAPTITSVEFLDNEAVADESDEGARGGGIDNTSSEPKITNALFAGNSATDGGGVSNVGSGPTITNSTFSDNTASDSGGAVFSASGDMTPASPVVQNSILWGDEAGLGDEIHNEGGTPIVRHSIVRGGLPDGTTDGGNNLDEDPDYADPANGDFRLRAGSPAINRGDNSLVPQDVDTDLDGNPRIFDGKIVDLGAYEFQANQPPTVDGKNPAATEDTELVITLSGSDPDGDALTFEIRSGPSNGSLGDIGSVVCSGGVPNECEAEVTYTPNPNYSGPDPFTYTANDETEDSEAAVVEITVNPVNDAPTVDLAGDEEVDEGATISYEFTVTDPDAGDAFEVSDGFPSCGDGGVFVSGSLQMDADGGSFECSFPDGPAQSTVGIQVEDSEGESSNIAELQVGVANVEPSISLSGPSLADEGDPEEYAFTVTDPGDDTQTVTTTCGENGEKVPDSDAFDQESGEGSFACLFPDGPAITDVTATVTDSDGARDADDRRVRVTVENVAPTIELEGDESADEGDTKTYAFSVRDPGDDPQSVTTSCGENGEKAQGSDAYDAQSGEGSFDCSFPDGPATTTVSVESDDGVEAGRAEREVDISNVSPEVELDGDESADEGETKTFTFQTSDSGANDEQGISTSCGENGEKVSSSQTYDAQSGEGSFKCLFSDGPSETVVFVEVDDGETVSRAEKTVEVSNVAPMVEGLSGRSSVRNGPVYTYTFSVTDPGEDDISYADGYPDCGENARLVGEPGPRSFRCRFTGNGSSEISVAVEDSDGAASNVVSRRVEIAPSAKSPCTIKGDGGRNVLRGTSGDDVICGLGGDDVIRGFGGDDVIKGGGGRDVIYGGPGDDLLFGGPGDDVLYGGPGKDRLVGGPGKNRLRQ